MDRYERETDRVVTHKLNIGNKGTRIRGDEPRTLRTWFPSWEEWLAQRPIQHSGHAREVGIRDGTRGIPDPAMLRSEFRTDYVGGYANGARQRYARREGRDAFKLFEQLYRPRDPNREPTVWMA
jgi:hypothetical protein